MRFLNSLIDDVPLVPGAVPEVHDKGLDCLKNRDPPITTKQQLMGHFMTLNCNEALFAALLVDAGLQPSRAAKCAEAFAAKAAQFCQTPDTPQHHFHQQNDHPGMRDVPHMVPTPFLHCVLRTDPLEPGMVPDLTSRVIDRLRTDGNMGFAKKGITTACQLMGYFLVLEFFEVL